jgi:hypothetical protein
MKDWPPTTEDVVADFHTASEFVEQQIPFDSAGDINISGEGQVESVASRRSTEDRETFPPIVSNAGKR